MGEIAESMLDGTCCETCGEYLGYGPGYPCYCSKACAVARGAVWTDAPPEKWGGKTRCPECGRKVKATGLRDHIRDMHSADGQPKTLNLARDKARAAQ